MAQGRVIDMGHQFRAGRSALGGQQWILFLLVLLAVILVVAIISRHINAREGRGYSSFRGLFSELCQAHHVNWQERRLLFALARRQGLTHPVFLFADPVKFAPDELPAGLRRRQSQIEALGERIFGASDDKNDERGRAALS
jgi:hypothetical protein